MCASDRCYRGAVPFDATLTPSRRRRGGQLMLFGVLLCLDSFLYLFTMYPLRVVMATFRFFSSGFGLRRGFSPSHKVDLVRAFLLFTSLYAVTMVDVSYVYHNIRGQSTVKLYVIYNLLEICDRLCASFGQDILDALYWSAIDKRRSPTKILTTFVVSVAYVCGHAMVLLYQIVALNVAMNSHSNALLTIVISNQFVEIKV